VVVIFRPPPSTWESLNSSLAICSWTSRRTWPFGPLNRLLSFFFANFGSAFLASFASAALMVPALAIPSMT
jgi:hypothetical protein